MATRVHPRHPQRAQAARAGRDPARGGAAAAAATRSSCRPRTATPSPRTRLIKARAAARATGEAAIGRRLRDRGGSARRPARRVTPLATRARTRATRRTSRSCCARSRSRRRAPGRLRLRDRPRRRARAPSDVFEGRCEGRLAIERREATAASATTRPSSPTTPGPDDERTMAELIADGEARDQPPRPGGALLAGTSALGAWRRRGDPHARAAPRRSRSPPTRC